MEKYNFLLQEKQSLSNDKDYVTIQAGKGKREDGSIYINLVEFSYVEGLIWDKFREYQNKSKVKISSADCVRILSGFNTAISELSTFKKGGDLKDILKFEIIKPQFPVNDVLDKISEIELLLNDLVQWITEMTAKEKYIIIFKKKN